MKKNLKDKKSLNIAMLGHKRIPSREGGIEIVVEELATRMVTLGHKVTCYSYSVPKEHQVYLKRYARKNNLKLVSICLYQPWCDLNINCHPLEFSSYIQFSECVYTTTFHGTIFTLLNHKNCAIYSPSKKLKDLLKWTHKEEAMLSLVATYDEFESLVSKQHSYELFETIIAKKRKESQEIYREALKSCGV